MFRQKDCRAATLMLMPWVGAIAVVPVSGLTVVILASLSAPSSTYGVGPDIITGLVRGSGPTEQMLLRHGRVGDITAYSAGTDVCNAGDEVVSCVEDTNQHPVITQGMYRLKDGRFEQIAMNWMVHMFFAIDSDVCAFGCDPTPDGDLGVGCSDPMAAPLNGLQEILGKRSDVNAHTGYFPYPFSAPAPDPVIGRRLQVHGADLDPDLNVGAMYFIQGHYIAPDDAVAENNQNNASYRPVTVVETAPDLFDIYVAGETQRQQPAIRAWQDTDSSVVMSEVLVPGEGLFIAAAKAIDLGAGVWHYEYAIQNLTSDRSGQSFAVPIPDGTAVNNIGFHDVDYHSGEIYDLTDWPATVADGTVSWSTDTYDVNPNANALRFDTLYNFYFDANAAPGPTSATLALFKPGAPEDVAVNTIGPSIHTILPPAPEPGGPPCLENTDCLGDWLGATCVDGTCYVPKNRHLSIDPTTNVLPVAYQLELTISDPYPTAVGLTRWVEAPVCYDYPNGGPVLPPPPTCDEGPDRFGWVAHLTSTPVTRVWTEVPLHITDCLTVPVTTYEIRATEDEGANFSDPLEINTIHVPDVPQYWGDLMGGPGTPGHWLPPDRTMNMADVQAAIRTFENRTEDTGFPPRVWSDVEINQVINMGDVQFLIMAFEGATYAEVEDLEFIGWHPADCP